MSSLLLPVICLLLGLCVAHLRPNPQELARNLNWWVLNIALPAAVLHLIPRLQLDTSLLLLPIAMWLVFGGSWLLFHGLGKRFGWSASTIGATVLTAGLSNASFVGFPLIEALRGHDALPYAAVADQLGVFLSLSVGGSLVVMLYSANHGRSTGLLARIVRFPPFAALIIALLSRALPAWPDYIDDVFSRVAVTLTPLALFSIGLQLRFKLPAHHVGPVATGLAWKLGLAPLMIYGLALGLGSFMLLNNNVTAVAVLQAAMGPMASAAILCEQHDLDPPLANFMVGVGVLISFVTVPLWNLALATGS